MRKGLVKKIISVTRGGKSFQQTVWVKPQEFSAQKTAKKLAKYEEEKAAGAVRPVKLKDAPWRYFEKPKGTKLVPLGQLDTTRARKVGIHNAAKFMHTSYKGTGKKRKPITVVKQPNGRYKVLDGNSTTNVAQQNKWKALPVVEVSPEEAEKIQAADKEKKAGKKAGAAQIARRKKVMTKFRRQAPDQGREATPTKQEAVDIIEAGRFALVSAGMNWKTEGDKSPEFFKERHEQLKKQLVADGFQFTQIKGVYNGGQEDSFLVWIHDADREHTKKLGESYNQDSVIYGENGVYEAHYTTGEDKGKIEETSEPWVDQSDVDFSKPEYAEDFYSEIPLADGGTFRFKLKLFEEGAINKPYEPGTRREYLYGVDDQAVFEKLAKRKKRR